MGLVEKSTNRIGAHISKMFLRAFSVGAAINLVKNVIDYAREVDKLTKNYKLTNEQAQQLLEYSRSSGQSIESMTESSQALLDAWTRIGELKIAAPFDDEHLQQIRDADATIQGVFNHVRVGLATIYTTWHNLFGGDWRNAMSPMAVSGLAGGRALLGSLNKSMDKTWGGLVGTIQESMLADIGRAPFGWKSKSQGALPAELRTNQYRYEDLFPPEIQALMIERLNAETFERMRGGDAKAELAKRISFAAPSDALAKIGGFVGTTDSSMPSKIASMDRHLANIEGALLSKGIKVQEL